MKLVVALLATICVVAAASAAPALAGPIVLTDITDATMSDYLLGEAFVAETRWGNGETDGDWEVGVGVPHTQDSSHLDSADLAWSSGTAYDFRLAYDGTTVTYDVGGVEVEYTASLAGNRLLIRLAGGTTHGTAALTIDEWSGAAITPVSYATSDGVLYLMASGLDLSQSWSLGGTQTLTAGADPRGSRPALLFKGGDIVPEPGTLALVGLGLAGITFGTIRRRRPI